MNAKSCPALSRCVRRLRAAGAGTGGARRGLEHLSPVGYLFSAVDFFCF